MYTFPVRLSFTVRLSCAAACLSPGNPIAVVYANKGFGGLGRLV